MRDYVRCGMGHGGAVQRNRDSLDSVRLMPRYLIAADAVDTTVELFGQDHAAPFGVAPVGLGGAVWPHAAERLASAARSHDVPFVASTFALASLERLRDAAGPRGWFQLYRPKRPEIESDLLRRAIESGYEVMVVTVDVPFRTRRDHDIRNGFSIPPRPGLRTVLDILAKPAWALAMARAGFPTFETLTPYVPDNLGRREALAFLSDLVMAHVTPDILADLRRRWPGTLLVKGVLDPREAIQCRDLGVDGIIVSNHGGRQLEAAPSAAEVLPSVRAAVGEGYPLIADGGIRTGLDICRMLALGADFVLMGRAFYYAVAAMGGRGADHAMRLLKAELTSTMGQLGCASLTELRGRLIT